MASPELACVYAALILNDDNIEITNEKIKSILNTAGINVESYWIDLFTEYFKSHDISELIKGTTFGSISTNSDHSGTVKQEIKEENKNDKEEEDEIEIEGGFDDLFN